MTSFSSAPGTAARFKTSLARRYLQGRIFESLGAIAIVLSLVVLATLLVDVLTDGLGTLNWNFLRSYPSRKPEEAGFLSAIVGSIWLMVCTAVISFTIGVGAGIFLEEFAPDAHWTRAIEININNLAAVPSIIYGLLGLQIFVSLAEPITGGRSVLSGSLTLSLLALPIIIVSTREALRAVPSSIRQGALALGATRWQTVRQQVLPLAFPGIMTGTILALSRAIGETAPLIAVGALTYIAFIPDFWPVWEGLQTPFTVMPIQIYNWVSRPFEEFHALAASGIIVLMVLLLLMNSIAIFIRNKLQRTIQ